MSIQFFNFRNSKYGSGASLWDNCKLILISIAFFKETIVMQCTTHSILIDFIIFSFLYFYFILFYELLHTLYIIFTSFLFSFFFFWNFFFIFQNIFQYTTYGHIYCLCVNESFFGCHKYCQFCLLFKYLLLLLLVLFLLFGVVTNWVQYGSHEMHFHTNLLTCHCFIYANQQLKLNWFYIFSTFLNVFFSFFFSRFFPLF